MRYIQWLNNKQKLVIETKNCELVLDMTVSEVLAENRIEFDNLKYLGYNELDIIRELASLGFRFEKSLISNEYSNGKWMTVNREEILGRMPENFKPSQIIHSKMTFLELFCGDEVYSFIWKKSNCGESNRIKEFTTDLTKEDIDENRHIS